MDVTYSSSGNIKFVRVNPKIVDISNILTVSIIFNNDNFFFLYF